MNNLKREDSLRSSIGKLEEILDFNSFKYKNVNIWPVIRISLILSRKKVTAGSGNGKLLKLKFIGLGILEYFKFVTGQWPKVSYVFLSSWHYKVEEENVFKDRILDPILNWINTRNKNFLLFEFTHHLLYPRNVSYPKKVIRLQPLLYFLSFYWRIEFMISSVTKDFKGDYSKLNDVVKAYGFKFRLNNNFYWRIFLLEKQKHFIKKVLSNMSVTHVGMVCYYDFKSLALTWAANDLGLKSIDFQHGVQGPYHMAYASWPKSIKNSPFFPSHYWVWDKPSQNTILEWKDPEKVILGTNKWMYDRINFKEPEIILCTLQPLENPFPKFLINAIKDYKGERLWFIRLHPHQLEEIEKFEDLLAKYGIQDKVNLRDASFMSLTELLSRTKVHITKSSSVLIEASYFRIPSIIIDPEGKRYYEKLLADEFKYYATDKSSILETLKQLENLDFRIAKETNSNNIDELQEFFQL